MHGWPILDRATAFSAAFCANAFDSTSLPAVCLDPDSSRWLRVGFENRNRPRRLTVARGRPAVPKTVGGPLYRPCMVKLGPSEVSRKSVAPTERVVVWARAAGRCVLCAKNLLDPSFLTHHYHSAELVGQIAHNAPASPDGPRSGSGLSRDERATAENLLLLCHDCHKNLDNPLNANLFTEARVLDMKREHELRVRRVTNFATMQKTLVLTNKGSLRGDAVQVSNPEITEALVDANLVAHVHDGWRSDIVITLDDEPADEAAWMRGRELIDRGLESLARGMHEVTIGHASVFALTFIPWLVYLGSRLDDIMSVEVFEKHRVAGNRAWCWADASDDTREFDTTATGQDDTGALEILIVTNLTGTVSEKRIPTNLKALPRVVLAPVGVTPAAGILRTKADLQAAADAWIRLLGQVEAHWPVATRLHVLGPIPASFAVRMGMHRMKTAHAELVVYHRAGDNYHPTPPITD